MKRRTFVSGITLGLLAPLAAQAQQPAKVPRVGVIGQRSPSDSFLAAFRQGLRELGDAEGQSIVIEYRYEHGGLDRVSKLATELICLNVDVLVVEGTVAARSAKALTTTMPIVVGPAIPLPQLLRADAVIQ